MIKRFTLLTRKPGQSKEEFMERWRHHGTLVARMPGLRRYVQSHVETFEYAPSLPEIHPVIDGFAELWFDDIAAMNAALASPEHDPLIPDGEGFIGGISTYISTEKLFVDGTRDGKLKRISLINRLPGQETDDFMKRWHHHGVLVSKLPGIHHYVQTHFQFIEKGSNIDIDIDGAGSQWFDDVATIRKADTSSVHDDELLPDGEGFLGGMAIYFTREKVIIAG